MTLHVDSVGQSRISEFDSAKVASVVSDSLKLGEVQLDSAVVASKIKEKLSSAVSDSLTIPAVNVDSSEIIEEGRKRLENELSTNVPTDSAGIANKVESQISEEIDKWSGINLNGIPKDSSAVAEKVESVGTEMLDETGIEISGIPKDSAAVKSEVSKIAKDEFASQTGLDVPDITLDSTTIDQVKKEAKSRAEAALKNTDEFGQLNSSNSELGKLTDMKSDVELTREEMQQMNAKKEMKQKMASKAKDFISQHSEKIQDVQSQMGELKKKYSFVPNSNDLSTAKKRSSLKGESFWKRLVLGGNLNISETNPVTIDFSPVVGWRFNKLFEAGLTGAYRAKFGADKQGINSFEDEDVYGYSVYANHMAFKNFFAYLEGENMSQVNGTTEDNKREWQQSLLVGVGRRFKVAKFLEMQAIITYNFLHDNQDGVYPNPVVFKTGFRVIK